MLEQGQGRALAGTVAGMAQPLVATVDYMETAVDDLATCAPSSVTSALYLLERIGEVPIEKKVSHLPAWISVLKSFQLELGTGARSVKKARARPLPCSSVGS